MMWLHFEEKFESFKYSFYMISFRFNLKRTGGCVCLFIDEIMWLTPIIPSPYITEAQHSSLPNWLPGQHVLQVCHHVRHHGPQRWAEVHVSRILDGHGVTFGVVEPEVSAVSHVEAGTWQAEKIQCFIQWRCQFSISETVIGNLSLPGSRKEYTHTHTALLCNKWLSYFNFCGFFHFLFCFFYKAYLFTLQFYFLNV